jgi:hypothetical protein
MVSGDFIKSLLQQQVDRTLVVELSLGCLVLFVIQNFIFFLLRAQRLWSVPLFARGRLFSFLMSEDEA